MCEVGEYVIGVQGLRKVNAPELAVSILLHVILTSCVNWYGSAWLC